MLQYIINTTAIWLLSLVVFDVFLRRESFHSYNRAYLLGTFILGLLLPLWQLEETGSGPVQYAVVIGKPIMHRSADVKTVIENSTAATSLLNLENILWSIYLAGAGIFLLLLLGEVFRLFIAYRKGDKTKDGVWTIVETGKQQSPYSAFRVVFLSGKNQYSNEHLRIILTHEEQHGHLLHFIDLLLMQVAKIVFWFHPLVYMYAERLATVHEFQADSAVDQSPKEYGRFLIEQSILGSAPAFSHSFNRSPIKKRIVMLTRHSSIASKGKMLLILPLLLVSVLCFSKNALSGDKRVKNGNIITYRGNSFVIHTNKPDTAIVTDPVTGAAKTQIYVMDGLTVESMNGNKVYRWSDIHLPGNTLAPRSDVTSYTANALKEYLLINLKDEIKHLKDGEYYLLIDCMVVDDKGTIAYYNYGGITSDWNNVMDVSQTGIKTMDMQDAYARKIESLIRNAPAHVPALYNNKNVPMQVSTDDFWEPFTVKNGKLVSL